MSPYLLRLLPPRPTFAADMTDGERSIMLEHVNYWTSLMSEGHVVAFGPVDDPAGGYGIGIVLADPNEIQALRDNDPALRSGRGFRTEIVQMSQLVTPTRIYAAH